MYDPSMTQQFMDPFQQEAIDASLRDISRAGEMERQKLSDAAVGAGALAVAVTHFCKPSSIVVRCSRWLTPQPVFVRLVSNKHNRLVWVYSKLLVAATSVLLVYRTDCWSDRDACNTRSGTSRSDIATLQGLGAMGQQQQQAVFDAQRATQLERLYEPYKRVGFMADIMSGTPSVQSSMTATPLPASTQPDRRSQLIGQYRGLGAKAV